MRKTILAAMIAAMAIPALPAIAQDANREYNRDVRDAQQDYQRDLRRADSPRDVREARQDYRDDVRDARRDLRDNRRDERGNRGGANSDWRQYRNYDWNRPQRGQRGYYAENYYRDGRYYQPRRLSRNDRIYRGNNGRYYCRRNDGTTGLIVGGALGGLLGNSIANGGSKTLATILGGGAGALLGQSIDRGQLNCR